MNCSVLNNASKLGNYQVQHLSEHILYYAPNLRFVQGQMIILGNAYGVMPYQQPLAQKFSDVGYESFWFPFRGQEGRPGHFSIRNAAEDLEKVIYQVKCISLNPDKPLYIIAHCASSLVVLEYLSSKYKDWEIPIKALIFYGLLAKPERLREKSEPRLAKAGVSSSLTNWDWNFPLYERLEKLEEAKIPTLFCHVDDVLNRRRSTLSELQEITKKTTFFDLKKFSRGYDTDLSNIDTILPQYLHWMGKISSPPEHVLLEK